MPSASGRPRPQPVLAPLTRSAIFLTAVVPPGGEEGAREVLGSLEALQRSVGFRNLGSGLACVAGVGSAVWDRLFTGPRPAGLHPFRALDGGAHRAPSTPGDLLFHIRAMQMDVCFELAYQLMAAAGPSLRVIDEVHGFRYVDERDLLGFVDGTENPTDTEAEESVRIGDEDPAFAGGSYVINQKYVHDMRAWEALTTERQEEVIGRTKLTDIEMDDDVQPADSHVALTTITDPDGTERKIVRHNMPFGRVGEGEFGTYFIGYSSAPDVTERMLENMFLGDPPGTYDRILDFSTALTGGLFHVPTLDFLDDMPEAPRERSGGASLGIGGLRGMRGTNGEEP